MEFFCGLNSINISLFPASVIEIARGRLPLKCLLCFKSELSSCLKLLPKQTGALRTSSEIWKVKSRVVKWLISSLANNSEKIESERKIMKNLSNQNIQIWLELECIILFL